MFDEKYTIFVSHNPVFFEVLIKNAKIMPIIKKESIFIELWISW
jgi:hypothetical protein